MLVLYSTVVSQLFLQKLFLEHLNSVPLNIRMMSAIVVQNYFGGTTDQAFTFTRRQGKRDRDPDQSDQAYPMYNECVI